MIGIALSAMDLEKCMSATAVSVCTIKAAQGKTPLGTSSHVVYVG